MKQILIFSFAFLFASTIFCQKKTYHYWTQVKTTNCKSYGISPSLQIGGKVISIGFAYTWTKSNCDEITYKNAIKIPKLAKGFTVGPDNKQYYNDGNIVYEVIGKSCSSKTWTPQEFWIAMQKM